MLARSKNEKTAVFHVFSVSGEVRRARRGGHVPGAVNTPYRAFLAEGTGADGSFRVFKNLEGIKEVGVYCVSRALCPPAARLQSPSCRLVLP